MSERSGTRRVGGLGGTLANAVALVSVVAMTVVGAGCSSSPEQAVPATRGQAAQGGASAAAKAGVGGGPAKTNTAGPGASAGTADPSATPGESPEEIRLAPDESQPPLPDGTFTGRFQGDEAAVSVRLVVRDGMVLVAHVEVVGKRRTSLDLRPMVAADARTLRFQGRFGADYLRLKGRFVDDRRAAGTFEGQVDRKRVSGRWYALRR